MCHNERLRLEHKLKSDKKRLGRLSDLCSKFVDLLTLQAFLLENERQNVDLTIEMYRLGANTLAEQHQRHVDVMVSIFFTL